jgi:hypothetical protein
VTELIRSPSRSHANRPPNPTVRRFLGPDSVVIQILIADRSGRDVTRRKGSIESLVSHCAPAVKAVVCRSFRDGMRHGCRIGKANLLIRVNPHPRALASGIPFTFANRNHGRVAVGIHVEAVVA